MKMIDKIANDLTPDEQEEFLDYYHHHLPKRSNILLTRRQVTNYGTLLWSDWTKQPWAQIIWEDQKNWICVFSLRGDFVLAQPFLVPKEDVLDSQLYTDTERFFCEHENLLFIFGLPFVFMMELGIRVLSLIKRKK